MSDPIVQIEDLTKQYKSADHPAISKLHLKLSPGSVFGLLGPNGAGKSTLVMLLCGLMKPTSGRLSIFGLDVMDHRAAIRSRIGVAPQEIALFHALTAYENLFYFGRMYGLHRKVLKSRIEEYLAIFSLADKAHQRVQTFSGGMKRRLNLIAALLHEPSLLILDEPTTGVDVHSRNMVIDFLQGLKAKGVTIIYSSHFLEEAERLCTDMAIIDEGKLIIEGTPPVLMAQHEDCHNLEELFLKLTGKNIRD